MPTETEPGDEYVRRIAEYVRTHGAALAAAAPVQKRRTRAATTSEASLFNPLGWFSSDAATGSAVKPVVLRLDPHHLFYLLMRIEGLVIDVGALDIKVDGPSRPMNYIELPIDNDKSDALSFGNPLSAKLRSEVVKNANWSKPWNLTSMPANSLKCIGNVQSG